MSSIKNQVLFLSIDGMTDALGQSQVLPYLIGLKQIGWQITLVSAEKPERYETSGKKIQMICSRAGIDWQPFTYRSGLPILSSIFNVWKMQRMAFQLQKAKEFDIVHCRSYIPALIGLRLKQSFSTAFLFDIRGFWVDEKTDGRIWNLKNPVHRLLYTYFKRKEKVFFNQADAIISLTEKAKPAICEMAGTENILSKINVIPCCVDTSHFNPEIDWSMQKDSWRKKLGIGPADRFLVYLGSLSTWYLPHQMFGFYKTLEKSIPGLRFLVVTGESPEPFRKLLAKENIDEKQVVFTSAQREDLPALLSLAEFAVCFYQSSFSRQATSPTKLAELMSMGIPIVCSNNVGDVNDILRETNTGAVCDPNDASSWHKASDRVIELSKIKSKSEIRSWAVRLFDVKIGISKYNEIYQKLIHQP